MQCKCTEYSTVHVTPVSLWPVHEDVIIDYRLGPNLDPDNTPWNVKQTLGSRAHGRARGREEYLLASVGVSGVGSEICPSRLGRAPLALIALAPQSLASVLASVLHCIHLSVGRSVVHTVEGG